MRGFLALVFVVAFVCMAEAREPVYSVAFHPANNTFKGWSKVEFLAYPSLRDLGDRKSGSDLYEFAVRSLTDPENKTRFRYPDPTGEGQWGEPFSHDEYFESLNRLGAGNFECAFLRNGARCSNVVRIKIEPGDQSASEPVLRVVPIQMIGENHVTHLGVWVVPPKKPDSRITNYSLHGDIILVVDGIEYERHCIWDGMVAPLKLGRGYGAILELKEFRPKIPAKTKCKVQVKMFEYESEVEEIAVDPDHGKKFDSAFGLK